MGFDFRAMVPQYFVSLHFHSFLLAGLASNWWKVLAEHTIKAYD